MKVAADVTCSAKRGLAQVELPSGAPGVALWRDSLPLDYKKKLTRG